MAKKNLASLMSGIMGERDEAASVAPIQKTEIKTATQQRENAPKKRETVDEKAEATTRKPGRPRKSEDARSTEIRATFVADSNQMKQIKYISLVDGCMLKDVIYNALAEYIANWEEINGKIKLPSSK